MMMPEQTDQLSEEPSRDAKLLDQDPIQFFEDDVTSQELVLGQDQTKDFRAQAPRRESADKHVRVEENPQDTSRNTSSSVRYPWVSANGVSRSRSCSKVMRAS